MLLTVTELVFMNRNIPIMCVEIVIFKFVNLTTNIFSTCEVKKKKKTKM